MLSILECGQMEHARTARTGLTLAKLVLSVTLTGTTLSDNHRAGLSVEVWHSHWQSHVSTGVVALFGSPHASAGLHLRCLAAYTQVQACNLVVMQPTRKCGFASTLPCSSYIATTPYCSPHASAGLQSCYHAVHTQVRVCIRFALHPARKCRFASLSSCGPQASAGLHSRCPAAHTHVQVCNQLSRSPHASAGVHLRRPLQLTCRCGGATRRSCSPHAV